MSVIVLLGRGSGSLVALPHGTRRADLFVVGSHGHRARTDLLLGSTTHHCIQRASCPAVVIPHRPKGGAR
ncbi:MAG: hypothetical protein EXQ81_10255 [Thermoleophilia bacterium]|nr:hypothetical protein [Thermoleophilia bacterium]